MGGGCNYCPPVYFFKNVVREGVSNKRGRGVNSRTWVRGFADKIHYQHNSDNERVHNAVA